MPWKWKVAFVHQPRHATPIRQRSKWGSRRAAAPGKILKWIIALIITGQSEMVQEKWYQIREMKITCQIASIQIHVEVLKYGTIWGGHHWPSTFSLNFLSLKLIPMLRFTIAGASPGPGFGPHWAGVLMMFGDVWWCLIRTLSNLYPHSFPKTLEI